jgi:hypothetical protein
MLSSGREFLVRSVEEKVSGEGIYAVLACIVGMQDRSSREP